MTTSGAFVLAFRQLGEPAFRRILIRALGLTTVTFVVVAVAVQVLLGQFGQTDIGWIDRLIQFLAGLGTILLAWFLFPVAITMMAELFLDEIATATESAHYPDDPPGTDPGFLPGLESAFRFGAVVLAVNLLALPLYLVLLFFPILLPVALYGINGYLLGREYFELAAHRHLSVLDARGLRHAHRWRIWTAGAAIAFLFTVPVINLAAPVIAAAAMVHVFKDLETTV